MVGRTEIFLDVDVTILVNLGEEEKVIKKIFGCASTRNPGAMEFAL